MIQNKLEQALTGMNLEPIQSSGVNVTVNVWNLMSALRNALLSLRLVKTTTAVYYCIVNTGILQQLLYLQSSLHCRKTDSIICEFCQVMKGIAGLNGTQNKDNNF